MKPPRNKFGKRSGAPRKKGAPQTLSAASDEPRPKGAAGGPAPLNRGTFDRARRETYRPKGGRGANEGSNNQRENASTPSTGAARAQSKLKTLDRVLSKAGLGSRREARSWIAAGRVEVNGKTILSPDHWVDLRRDRISLDHQPIAAARKIYLLLYKPKGYLTTYKDPEGRKTVYDLLPGIDTFVSPVGRLDLDSSGLLLMTNDNAFADFVTSPESKVAKTYLVKSSMLMTDEQLDRLRAGIELADGPTRPAVVTRVRDSARYSFFEITITEGRNRQVRRMVEALGAKVLKLVRVRIGEVGIGDLQIGAYRELTAREIARLNPPGVSGARDLSGVRKKPRSKPRGAGS